MNTFRRKKNLTRCSKFGLALLLALPSVAAQQVTAKEICAKQPVTMLMTSPMLETSETVYYFVASLTDGSQLSIPFSERPVLTCQGNDLLLTTTKMELELPHGSVKEFTLDKKEEATGVEELRAESKMERIGDSFLFTDCRAGSIVTAFDGSGRRIASQRVDENGRCELSLQGQPNGIYIIKSESITCKILKK